MNAVGFNKESGVRFESDTTLVQLGFDGFGVTSVRLQSGAEITAGCHILATKPVAEAGIVARTAVQENERGPRRFEPLTRDGPRTQVSFRIPFRELILFPRERTAVVVTDSEFIAGTQTKTAADVWSTEAAVESGRRAARAIDPRVKVIPQYKPLWLQVIDSIDDRCNSIGAPHVLDLFWGGILAVPAAALGLWFDQHVFVIE